MPKVRIPLEVPAAFTQVSEAALRSLFSDFVTEFTEAARQQRGTSQYESTYKEYKALMDKLGFTGSTTALSLAVYLIIKSKAIKSAASVDGWATHVTKMSAKRHALVEFSSADKTWLRDVKRACRVTFRRAKLRKTPWGMPLLEAIQQKLCPAPTTGMYDYAIFTQMLVHHSSLARPGDICGDYVVARAGHVEFLASTSQLPQGGVHIDLETDKGDRLMGHGRPTLLQVCGTGGPMCPRTHLETLFNIYNLHDNPDEPIFAEMNKDGSRKGPPGASQGASFISNKSYNTGIRSLAKRAGMPYITASGARPGRKIELACAGAADPVVTCLGRWHTYQASRPYDSQTIALLHHLVKILDIKPDQQAAITGRPAGRN